MTGLNISSVQMSLSYDTAILEAINISNDGTVAPSWDSYSMNLKEDGLDIEFSGPSFSGSGSLVLIEFKVIGDDGQFTPIQFESIAFTPSNVIATTTDGSFQVNPGQVVISLPADTSGMSGTPISIPVTVSDVTGLDILLVTLVITYNYDNPDVLDAFSVSTENTIAESWPEPTFNDFTNRAYIRMSGTVPLEGAGPLIYINFNITGPDKTTSELHFMNAVFNVGSPIAIKQDGKFTVEGVIPVELASFEATVLKGDVLLTWTTVSESNNYGYEIQRKHQDQSAWKNIAFVKGNGTTDIPHSYSHVDQNLSPGAYSYRLKQIDFNGAFEYSDIREVTVDVPIKFSLEQNYPNPFNPDTKIKYQIPESALGSIPVDITIYNLLGSKIKTLIATKQSSGFYTVYWNGTDEIGNKVPTGIYVYRLRAGNHVATRRMVLMK